MRMPFKYRDNADALTDGVGEQNYDERLALMGRVLQAHLVAKPSESEA